MSTNFNTNQRFMIIDDDPINNRICVNCIKKLFPKADIITFVSPEEGLEFIRREYKEDGNDETMLLLDLNMPVLSGWDVLDSLAVLPKRIQDQFNIYILTSSIDRADKMKAYGIKLVFGFFEKPLSDKQVESMFLVKKYKNSFIAPVTQSSKRVFHYRLPDDDRRLLDQILPYFELNESTNIAKCIRQAFDNDPQKVNNMPIGLLAERLGTFLVMNGFAHNLSGNAIVSKKGMELKNAGSLSGYERISTN